MRNLDLKVARKLLNLEQSAKARGKEFNLTFTSVKNMMRANKCYYTGRPLNNENRSIDRVDNSKGYVIGNVVACHVEINQAKDRMSTKDIFRMANKLKKRNKS